MPAWDATAEAVIVQDDTSDRTNVRANDNTTKVGLRCDEDTWAREEFSENPVAAVHKAKAWELIMAGNAPKHGNVERKSSCRARFSASLSEDQCCEVKIQCEMRLGREPLPTKNKNSLKFSLLLIGFFQKCNVKSCGQTERGWNALPLKKSWSLCWMIDVRERLQRWCW